MQKPLLILILCLAAACEREPSAPLQQGRAFDWMNNPDNGNPVITRFETGYLNCWTDRSNNLRACAATVPMGTPQNRDPDCGLQGAIDPVSKQWVGEVDVINLYDSWIRSNTKGDVWITVRDMNQAGTCFGKLLLAEGMGRISSLDNDIYGTPDNHNANAFGFTSAGILTAPDGSRVAFEGGARWIYNEAHGVRGLYSTVHIGGI